MMTFPQQSAGLLALDMILIDVEGNFESRLSSCQWGYDAVCSLSRTSLSEACGMLDNATYFLDTLLSASTSGSDF